MLKWEQVYELMFASDKVFLLKLQWVGPPLTSFSFSFPKPFLWNHQPLRLHYRCVENKQVRGFGRGSKKSDLDTCRRDLGVMAKQEDCVTGVSPNTDNDFKVCRHPCNPEAYQPYIIAALNHDRFVKKIRSLINHNVFVTLKLFVNNINDK